MRKVTVDYAKGLLTIALKGIELGAYDKGESAVPLCIEFDDIRFEDQPVLTGNGKSLKY